MAFRSIIFSRTRRRAVHQYIKKAFRSIIKMRNIWNHYGHYAIMEDNLVCVYDTSCVSA